MRRLRYRRAALRAFTLSLSALPLLAGCGAASSNAVALVRVTEQVVLESPHRLGVNIGGSAYYGDQQHVENAFAHGGFFQGRQALMVRTANASGNAFNDANFDRNDPDRHYVDSFAGGTYCIATGARAGETGSISEHDTETGRYTLENSGAPLDENDLVWLRGPWVRRAQPDPQDPNIERSIGIGDFRPIAGDGVSIDFVDTDADTHDQALRITFAPGSGRVEGGVKHYIAGTMNDTYTVVVRARCDTPGAELGVDLRNFGIPSEEPGGTVRLRAPEAARLTPEFQEFRFTGETYPDARISEGISVFDIVVSAETQPGAEVHADIDAIALEDAALDTPSGFSRPMAEAIAEAQCGVLRFYGVASLASPVEDITARSTTEATWTYASLESNGRFSGTDAVVDQWMTLAQDSGAQPWLTIGGANTPDEWYDLISYLCAPSDFDAYSARRADHGHAAPWSDAFDTMYLEIGNEWWNPVFQPYYAMPPEKYGELCNTIIQRVRSHPHFDDAKIQLVAGGWAVNGHHWNGVVDQTANGVDAISIAPYLLHELDKYAGDEAKFGALFADVEAYARNGGASTLNDLEANGKGTKLAVYELNTHTAGGGAPASIASTVTASAAAGVAVLDQAMAVMSGMQADPINYFTILQRGYNDRLGLWGTLIREPSGALRPRPVWHGLRLANQFLIDGDMVTASVEGEPDWDQPENGSVPATDNVPYLASYAFLDDAAPRKLNVLVVNRHRKDDLRVSFALPFAVSPEVHRARLAPHELDANNEAEETVKLEETDLHDFTPESELIVPPGSATVFQFTEAP